MGININDVLSKAKNGDKVNVAIVTNQDDGISSYTVGNLKFESGETSHGFNLFYKHLVSTPGSLTTYFSDREVDISTDTGTIPPHIHTPLLQPFSINATEAPQITLVKGFVLEGQHPLHLNIRIFGHSHTIQLQEMGNLLVGEGQILWGNVPNAVYIVAFTNLSTPQIIN